MNRRNHTIRLGLLPVSDRETSFIVSLESFALVLSVEYSVADDIIILFLDVGIMPCIRAQCATELVSGRFLRWQRIDGWFHTNTVAVNL